MAVAPRNGMHSGVLTLPRLGSSFRATAERLGFTTPFGVRRFRRPLADCRDRRRQATPAEPDQTLRMQVRMSALSQPPYWGRWSEQGQAPYREAQSDAYPAFDPDCGPEGRQRGSTRCRLHYINEIFVEDDARKPTKGICGATCSLTT